MPGTERQNNMFDASPAKNFVQDGNPFAVTSCGRRRNTGQKVFEMDSPLEKRKRKKKTHQIRSNRGNQILIRCSGKY